MISGVIGAVAFLAIAAAANDLFIATERTVYGAQRWLVFGVAYAGAVIQAGLIIAPNSTALQILGVLSLAALPASFWPVLRRLKRGKLQVINSRLTRLAARAAAAAAASDRFLAMAEQSAHVGHWELRVPGNDLKWSDEVYRIHGLWREHYTPRLDTALAAFHPVDSKRVGNILLEALASHGKFEVAARLRRPDGDIRHVILRGETHGNAAGQVESLIGVMVDVTEPKRLESRLLPHAAQRDIPLEDNLTGLADRQQFDLSLNYEYKRAMRSKKPLGMVLLEIDHFAEYAAHYGVMGADACLRQVAHSVHALPRRTGDVVARFGRAEIAILLPLADAAGALRVANSVAESIRALVLAHAAHDSGVVTISCGAASIGMDDLYNPQELPRRAARALAQAQVQGGNQAVAFEPERMLEIVRD